MTREEQLDWLCRLRSEIYVYMPKEWLIPMNDALDMTIKALSQEPCDDIAQERYKDLCEYFGGAKDILKSREDFKAWLGRVKWHIRKAEELYEKYEYKKEPCDDAISREDAYKIVMMPDTPFGKHKGTLIRELPSVTTMRDATPKEQKSVNDYIKSISTPTGVKFSDAISRDAVIKAVDAHTNEDGTLDDDISVILEDLPSVTQKSGKWIYKEITDDYRVTGQCSECKERRIIDNYCPNCGAKNGE